MTRTTGALKRLGVAGVAIATIGTGLIALPVGAAFAAHEPIQRLEITPAASTGAAGTCELFVITAFNATTGQTAAGGRVVDVTLTESTDTTNVQDFDFCTTEGAVPGGQPAVTPQGSTTAATALTGNQTPQAPSDASAADTTTGATTDRAEFTTDANGRIVFGVIGANFTTGANLTTNTVAIRAFAETTDNDTFNAGEPTDTSTYTTTPGGAAGSNEAANAVDTVNAEPETGDIFQGDVVTIIATLANVNGDVVAGVTPILDVESGPNAAVTNVPCTVSNNLGRSTCTYTASAAPPGTDSIRIYVNNITGTSQNFEPLAGEESDVVTRTVRAAVQGLVLNIEPENVNVPRAGGTANYTVSVQQDTGATSPSPAANQIIKLTIDTTNVTVAATGTSTYNSDLQELTLNGTTGGFSVTPTRQAAGDVIRITGTIRGQNTAGDVGEDATTNGERSSDTVTLTVTNAVTDARYVTITPGTVTTAPGDVRTFTARVTDVDGRPVAGVVVTFTESGPGRFANGTSQVTVTTGSDGTASVDVTSFATESGAQTITASILNNASGANQGTQCQQTNTSPNTAAGTTPRAGNCTATATNNIGNTPPPASDTAVARITLNVTSGRITAGNAPFLFGIVTDRNGAPVANRQVTILERRYNETSYRELQTATDVTTNNRGEFRTQIRPERQTAYVARVTNADNSAVQSDARGSTGRAVIVQVHNRINIATPAGGATASNRSIQVRGDLDPNYASVRIGVSVLRNGRFTYITQGITDANGAFVINVRNLPRGSYALVVYTSARQGNLFGSASRAINTP